jgi:hypothetical protein
MSIFPKTSITATLLISILLLGCRSDPKASIERVLKEDRVFSSQGKAPQGDLSNEALKTLADETLVLAGKMKHIDLSGCPPEFAVAYIAHARAWESFGGTLHNHPDILTSGAEQIQNWRALATRSYAEIDSTWKTVEDIAVRNGARLP